MPRHQSLCNKLKITVSGSEASVITKELVITAISQKLSRPIDQEAIRKEIVRKKDSPDLPRAKIKVMESRHTPYSKTMCPPFLNMC